MFGIHIVNVLQGSGWWKYKFCYGKSVVQYHIEKQDGRKQGVSFTLGVFNKNSHLDWLKRNPHKRPKPLSTRTFVSHFYGGGAPCENSGKQRETEVRIKII